MSLNSLNIILAQATGAPAMQQNPTGQLLNTVGMFVLMGVMLYFVMIRPQTKKAKEHATMLKSIKAGDKVITTGGVVGTVIAVKDKTVSIRSADTKLEVLKSAISDITERSGEGSAGES